MKNRYEKFVQFLGVLCAIFYTATACQHAGVGVSPQLSDVSPRNSALIPATNERPREDKVEASGTHFAISTQGRSSTEAAKAMLLNGGNLIDAAIATSFVLAVERPHSTGLTGGGFLLYREAKTGTVFAIDFRERAPLAASPKMFLDKEGKPVKARSQDSILASGVPGLVAGLTEIHQRFGRLPLATVMAPAIDLAEKGFPIYPSLAKALQARAEILVSNPYSKSIFAGADGKVLKESDLLVQKDLANTLRAIAGKGRAGFYAGAVSKNFLGFFASHHGLISAKDLKSYKVHWRDPVRAEYKGFEIVSMPPPSSGGVHVIQVLKFLENDSLKKSGYLSTESIHLAAASLQSAFADRAKYMGDPDFTKIPVRELVSKKYLESRRNEVSINSARRLKDVNAGTVGAHESSETTHFSMIDAEGNMVSSTQTINGWMGSGLMVPKTGLVLNNEMDDFTSAVGAQNLFQAVGGEPNIIQPQKTPLSSMAPTLVLKNEVPILAVGAPGGTRIISCVAQTILNFLEFEMPLYDSVASIRYHHQWQPDTLQVDPPGPSTKTISELRKLGYDIELKPIGCSVMGVAKETSNSQDILRAVADPRDIGTSYAE